MQARRDKGLCYNCDEKYSRNHKCKSKFLLLLHDDSEDIVENVFEHSSCTELELNDVADAISYHALSGNLVPRTLRFSGNIRQSQVSVLLDTGSTNNFIQTRVAKHLGLVISPANSFQVMIGDGQKLPCSGLCKDVIVDIQGFSFTTSFYVLPIQGAELVLRVQWLQVLGPITIDYSELTMKFSHLGNPICLHGDQSPTSS